MGTRRLTLCNDQVKGTLSVRMGAEEGEYAFDGSFLGISHALGSWL